MEMKKITLVLSVLLFIGSLLGACSEKEVIIDKVPEEEKVAAVTETPKIEVKEELNEEVETTTSTENVSTDLKLNYENNLVGIQDGVLETLENINTILISGTNHSWKGTEIKAWFYDYDGSNAKVDEYIALLAEKGIMEKDLTDRYTKTLNVVEGPDKVWTLDLEKSGNAKGQTIKHIWNITAQPGPTGDLVININSIK